MLPIQDIIITAWNEHEHEHVAAQDPDSIQKFIDHITSQLADPQSLPAFSHGSKPLSLVSFHCMLQDTGYAAEVYLPGKQPDEPVDWSRLKERWVGWGVEIPGENDWEDGLAGGLSSLRLDASHPPAPQNKFPLPDKSDYLGALIKVYDDVTFRPASTHTFIGLVSAAPLPSPVSASEDAEIMVPAIHVISRPEPKAPEADESTRSVLLQYLATSLSVDSITAEYILLALLASPSVRPPALPPLGTLSLNLIGAPAMAKVLRKIVPALVELPLTLSTLHSVAFTPASTDSSLSSGLLQLAEGTVLLVDETAMGNGGALQEKAVRNLQALTDCMSEQKLRYEYPYMDGLKIETCLRPIVLSDGKSLLPVDIYLPVKVEEATEGEYNLPAFRSYLQYFGSTSHARTLTIPEATAAQIQEDFIAYRRQGMDAEDVLKRRMKIARLLAVSYQDGQLSAERWQRVVEMDEAAQERMRK